MNARLASRFALYVAASVALVLCACSDEDKAQRRREMLRAPDVEQERKKRRQAERITDAEGKLLASENVVAGLRLPRGLREHFVGDKRWVYHAAVAPRKLHQYFGPRLITGKVVRRGGATTYVAAEPINARGTVKLDVKIGPLRAHPKVTVIDIEELPTGAIDPPSQAQVERELGLDRE